MNPSVQRKAIASRSIGLATGLLLVLIPPLTNAKVTPEEQLRLNLKFAYWLGEERLTFIEPTVGMKVPMHSLVLTYSQTSRLKPVEQEALVTIEFSRSDLDESYLARLFSHRIIPARHSDPFAFPGIETVLTPDRLVVTIHEGVTFHLRNGIKGSPTHRVFLSDQAIGTVVKVQGRVVVSTDQEILRDKLAEFWASPSIEVWVCEKPNPNPLDNCDLKPEGYFICRGPFEPGSSTCHQLHRKYPPRLEGAVPPKQNPYAGLIPELALSNIATVNQQTVLNKYLVHLLDGESLNFERVDNGMVVPLHSLVMTIPLEFRPKGSRFQNSVTISFNRGELNEQYLAKLFSDVDPNFLRISPFTRLGIESVLTKKEFRVTIHDGLVFHLQDVPGYLVFLPDGVVGTVTNVQGQVFIAKVQGIARRKLNRFWSYPRDEFQCTFFEVTEEDCILSPDGGCLFNLTCEASLRSYPPRIEK